MTSHKGRKVYYAVFSAEGLWWFPRQRKWMPLSEDSGLGACMNSRYAGTFVRAMKIVASATGTHFRIQRYVVTKRGLFIQKQWGAHVKHN